MRKLCRLLFIFFSLTLITGCNSNDEIVKCVIHDEWSPTIVTHLIHTDGSLVQRVEIINVTDFGDESENDVFKDWMILSREAMGRAFYYTFENNILTLTEYLEMEEIEAEMSLELNEYRRIFETAGGACQ